MKTALLFAGVSLVLNGLSAPGAFGEETQDEQAGQTPSLTIAQAIDQAKSGSPLVQRAHAVVDEGVWKKREALGAGFLPRLSANANHYFNTKFEYINLPFNGSNVSFPSLYPTSSLGLNASIPIFDGLANVEHLEAAGLAQSADEAALGRAEFQLEQDVRLAFYDALGAQLLKDVAEQNIKTLEDHLKQVEAMKHGGAATSYDILRVQVQLTEASSDAVDARDNVELTRRKLTQLMGQAAAEPDSRRLIGELPAPLKGRVEPLAYEGVPSTRDDLTALDLRSQAASKERTAQGLWFVPRVSIGGEYDFYNNIDNTVTKPDNFRSAYNTGVFLQWSLFDGGVSLARSAQAAAHRTQVEKTSDEARLQVPYDFDLWKRRFLSNAQRFESKRLDVQRSEESVRLARLGERAGSRTSTEVLDAELDLFRAKAGVVTAQMNSAQALIKLELALGRRI